MADILSKLIEKYNNIKCDLKRLYKFLMINELSLSIIAVLSVMVSLLRDIKTYTTNNELKILFLFVPILYFINVLYTVFMMPKSKKLNKKLFISIIISILLGAFNSILLLKDNSFIYILLFIINTLLVLSSAIFCNLNYKKKKELLNNFNIELNRYAFDTNKKLYQIIRNASYEDKKYENNTLYSIDSIVLGISDQKIIPLISINENSTIIFDVTNNSFYLYDNFKKEYNPVENINYYIELLNKDITDKKNSVIEYLKKDLNQEVNSILYIDEIDYKDTIYYVYSFNTVEDSSYKLAINSNYGAFSKLDNFDQEKYKDTSYSLMKECENNAIK